MIWQDRERTDPTKRKFIDENGNEQNVNIEEIESNITQNGTPVNAVTMNNIEQNLGTYGNDTYDSTATYLEGETVTHNALLYRAKQDIETPEEWTAAHWEQTSALQELANTSGNEIAIGTEEDITRQTKALIKQGNYRYINSEIDNQYGTATNKGYSQEYINEMTKAKLIDISSYKTSNVANITRANVSKVGNVYYLNLAFSITSSPNTNTPFFQNLPFKPIFTTELNYLTGDGGVMRRCLMDTNGNINSSNMTGGAFVTINGVVITEYND